MLHPDENAALGVCGLCGRNPQELEQTIEQLHSAINKVIEAFDKAPLSDTWWMPEMQAVTVLEFLLLHSE